MTPTPTATAEAPPLDWTSDGATIQRHAFAYRPSPDQAAPAPVHHAMVVVGAGPVGLSLAIDLAQRGQRVLLLDNDHRLSTGSRAICFAKRTLDIWDRLGVGEAMCAKGVKWNVGRVFLDTEPLYHFNLLPEAGHARPAFINLQQYYAEAYLALRAAELPNLEIRWRHAVTAIEPREDGVALGIETPEGPYTIDAGWVAACDGSRSPLRTMLGLDTQGRVFRDRFLIADVRMDATANGAPGFPAERWFWFDPPFHRGQSVLLHSQPDGVWRIDFQLGWQADPELEKQPERIRPRVDAMMRAALGHTVPFTLEWASVYTFACQRMARFRHGRVLFAGDSAHGVSPFGARGANSGVQDADNLGWKLDAVLRGRAAEALLDSYACEREYAADENLLNSTRATDFITPKSEVSRLFRDAVLSLSRQHPFTRSLVNSGRLSVPSTLDGSPLNTPDVDDGAQAFSGPMRPGAPAVDAPVHGTDGSQTWLLRRLGEGFTLLAQVDEAAPGQAEGWRAWAAALSDTHPTRACVIGAPGQPGMDLIDTEGLVARRYDLRPGSAVLLRPDQHVCARWRRPTLERLHQAQRRALALDRRP